VLIDSDPDHRWLGTLLSSDKPGKEPAETQGKDSDTVKPATGPPTAEAGAPGS
jgi:hypothetical protein